MKIAAGADDLLVPMWRNLAADRLVAGTRRAGGRPARVLPLIGATDADRLAARAGRGMRAAAVPYNDRLPPPASGWSAAR